MQNKLKKLSGLNRISNVGIQRKQISNFVKSLNRILNAGSQF